MNIRSRLYFYLENENINKDSSTILMIGCSKELLNKWISWNKELDNLYEDIHIDHFIPLSSYNCKTFDDIIESKCNHWTNLRPMKAFDNMSKGSKIPINIEKIKMELRVNIFQKKYNL